MASRTSAPARKNDRVAVFQIGDHIGEWGKRDGVRSEIHFAFAEADREGRTLARPDQEIVLAVEQKNERERAAKPRQGGNHRLDRRAAIRHLPAHQMGDYLGVRFRGELRALLFKLFAQFAEILDDAVVHNGEPIGSVGVGIGLVGLPVRGPARVADAYSPLERIAFESPFEITELAFGAAAFKLAVLESCYACGIVTSIF